MAMNGNQMGDEVIAAIQALSNFPESGKTANVIDPRVVRAFCSAVVAHIQANADVLSAAHSGSNLNNPAGQTVHVSTSTGDGATTAPEDIAGKGSVV